MEKGNENLFFKKVLKNKSGIIKYAISVFIKGKGAHT
jgi:hypothetical protein